MKFYAPGVASGKPALPASHSTGESYSIKKVLPVLVPDMGYDDLEIGDGLEASAVFAYMSRGRYSREEESRKREQLLVYCGVDTMAMVRLAKILRHLVRR